MAYFDIFLKVIKLVENLLNQQKKTFGTKSGEQLTEIKRKTDEQERNCSCGDYQRTNYVDCGRVQDDKHILLY